MKNIFVFVLCLGLAGNVYASDLEDRLTSAVEARMKQGTDQNEIVNMFADARDDITAIEDDNVGSISFSIGSEVSDEITVTATLVNSSGDALADDVAYRVWLTDLTKTDSTYTRMLDAEAGAVTTSVPNSDFRINPNTGIKLKEETTDALLFGSTGDDGVVSFVISDSGAVRKWYLCMEADGKIATSLTVAHA